MNYCNTTNTLFKSKVNILTQRGHWTVNYTGTQSLFTTKCYSLAPKLSLNPDWLVHTFRPTIIILSTEGEILFILIGEVNEFIFHS